MQIEIKAKAMKNLAEIADYLDSINTFGAGSRWLDKFFERINTYAKRTLNILFAKNSKLANKSYCCISYRNWVVAFKIYKSKFVIYEVIFGPILY